MKMTKEGTLLWQPPAHFKTNSNLQKYIDWLKQNRNLTFANYEDLWQWSVNNLEDFWESVWSYFQIGPEHSYLHVLPDRKMPGTKWFTGAKLNYAGYLFRNKQANKPAIISFEIRSRNDHLGRPGTSGGRFAAALTASGVKRGQGGCLLPNIPEAVVAFWLLLPSEPFGPVVRLISEVHGCRPFQTN